MKFIILRLDTTGDFCLKYPADQWINNQIINTNILNWWKQKNSKAKLVFIELAVVMMKMAIFQKKIIY